MRYLWVSFWIGTALLVCDLHLIYYVLHMHRLIILHSIIVKIQQSTPLLLAHFPKLRPGLKLPRALPRPHRRLVIRPVDIPLRRREPVELPHYGFRMRILPLLACVALVLAHQLLSRELVDVVDAAV